MGTVRADTIVDGAGTGAPNFTNGIQLAGTALAVHSSSADGLAPQISDGTLDAVAGEIGELITANALTAITTATATNMVTISLSAGVWDVEYWFGIDKTGANVVATDFVGGISLTPATFEGDRHIGRTQVLIETPSGTSPSVNFWTMNAPKKRYAVTSTTTVYGVNYLNFTGAATNIGAFLRAVRVR